MLPNTMSRCDYLDLLELVNGRRSACRISVRDDLAGDVLYELSKYHFEFGILPSPYQVADIYGHWDDQSKRYRHDDQHEIYIAHDVMTIHDVLATEYEHDYDGMGRFYGYPPCCVEAFRQAQFGQSEFDIHDLYPHLSSALCRSKKFDRFYTYMTPDLDNRILSFFPCVFNCEQAIERARWRLEMTKTFGFEVQPTVFAERIFDVT